MVANRKLLPLKPGAAPMDRISRFFIRRLRHLARREARRIALLNGLIECRIVEDGGHVLRRYGPAFDTSGLTGDPDRDLAWLRRRFGAGLIEPPKPAALGPGVGANAAAAVEDGATPSLATLVTFPSRGRAAQGVVSGNGFDRRSYAVRLVAAAAETPLVSHVVAALVLARAVREGKRPLRDIVRAIAHATPVVTLHAPLGGFEREISRLLEKSRFVPGGPFAIVDGDYMFNDDHFDVQEGESRRRIVAFLGASVHRITGKSLRRRLVSALARDFPIVAIAEKVTDIPAMLQISADVTLTAGRLDREFIRDVVEALYPAAPLDGIDLPADSDTRWLSLEDLILAFRPGRALADALSVLVALAERNREDAEDGDDEKPAKSPPSRKTVSQSPSQKDKESGGSDGKKPSDSDDTSSGWRKKPKPSGAEIIQPQPPSSASGGGKPPLTVETLSGYGKARDWAVDLKADLADYNAGILGWSDMSTKLLLFGPPGTGKTTFARALCNSLQIPLVVTSVSTSCRADT